MRLGSGSVLELGSGEFKVNNPGIELGDSVFDIEKVLPHALKEADRFTQPIARIHAHTQGCHNYV